MSFPVFDFRTDIRNLLVTPQIRGEHAQIGPNDPIQAPCGGCANGRTAYKGAQQKE